MTEKNILNQCDGCRRKLPIKDGVHCDNENVYMCCTAEIYQPRFTVYCWQTNKKSVILGQTNCGISAHNMADKHRKKLVYTKVVDNWTRKTVYQPDWNQNGT